LWTIQPRIRVGAVFRQGTSFDFTQVDTVVGLPTTTEIGRFQTPHVIGGGVRVEATERLTFAVDYDRVAYSRLNQDYIMFQVPPSAVSRVGIPDGNEVHGGISRNSDNTSRFRSSRDSGNSHHNLRVVTTSRSSLDAIARKREAARPMTTTKRAEVSLMAYAPIRLLE
jgi:hypothetical protein